MSPDRSTLDELRITRPTTVHRRTNRWVVPLIIVALIVIAGVAAWWLNRSKPIEVRVAVARVAGDAERATLLNASGYITPRRAATVSSKVTGKVIEVLIEEGMKVEAGQVLARLDASNTEASLGLAEAQARAARAALEETRVSLALAERELRRMSELAQNRIAAQSELDSARTDVDALQARLAKQVADVSVAEREVTVWQQQLEDTIVRAPFAGIVTEKNAQPGEMISPISAGGGFTRTGICTIVDMSSLEIEVDVNESYINRVIAGQPVEATLDAYPDWRVPAKVLAIIPTADRQKATVKVRVAFEQLDPRILPDMGVKVAFRGPAPKEEATRPTVWIPKSAVRQEDGREVVWIVQNGRAERRAIGTGTVQGDEQMVRAGLKGGEKVVIDSSVQLSEGNSVVEARP